MNLPEDWEEMPALPPSLPQASVEDDNNAMASAMNNNPAAPTSTATVNNVTSAAANAILLKPLFPDILHEVLSCTDEEVTDAIAWLPHGRAFSIKNPQNLEAKLMPRFFGKGKYSSFIRRLNRWGFRLVADKSGPDSGAFRHELFLRDQPGLARDMSCQKVGSVRGINYAKRQQNALESMEASLEGNGGPHGNAAAASALLPDYMVEASLQQRADYLHLMGQQSLASAVEGGGGLHAGFAAGGYPPPPPPPPPGYPRPKNEAAAAFYGARAYAPPVTPPKGPIQPVVTTNPAESMAPGMFAGHNFSPHQSPPWLQTSPTSFATDSSPMMRGMPTAYGGAATTANPYASALTYEQLLARNTWLESALRDIEARRAIEAGAESALRDIEARRAIEAGAGAGYAAGAAVFPCSGSAAAPGAPDGAADGANAVETALFAEAPAPAAPASSAPDPNLIQAPAPEAKKNAETVNSVSQGVVADETELLAEAPALAPPAVSAPASAPEAGTNVNTANRTPPGIITDETELLAEAPAPAPASTARTPDPAGTSTDTDDKSTNGTPPGVTPEATEMLAEALAPWLPASSARGPAPAQVAGTIVDTGDISEPVTEEIELMAEVPAPASPASLALAPAPEADKNGDGFGPITDGKGVPITSVGYSFEKRFKGHGWFKGKVVEIRPGAAGGKDRRCEYEDGDMEDLSLHQLRSLYHATQKKMTNQQGRDGASAASEFGTLSRGETKTDNGDMEDLSLRQLRSLAGSAFGT